MIKRFMKMVFVMVLLASAAVGAETAQTTVDAADVRGILNALQGSELYDGTDTDVNRFTQLADDQQIVNVLNRLLPLVTAQAEREGKSLDQLTQQDVTRIVGQNITSEEVSRMLGGSIAVSESDLQRGVESASDQQNLDAMLTAIQERSK